jgi:hypothetical protein
MIIVDENGEENEEERASNNEPHCDGLANPDERRVCSAGN